MTYSQGTQDDVLKAVFARIGVTNKQCVEFGFNADTLFGGTGANTARLIFEDGWTGVLFDQDYANPIINLHRERLTPCNIGDVFARYGVLHDVDYVSIDVDSIDLWLFKAMLDAGYRPRVVSVEYNANYGIDESVTVRPGTVWLNGDRCYGASLKALHKVASRFNYQLVDVVPSMDAFFVRGDLWESTVLADFAYCTRLPMHVPATPERAAAVMMEY